MGTWAAGPFDNDSAADFASDVNGCTDADARHDLLMATLRAGSQLLGTPGVELSNEFSWGYELEMAIAAAAFVADAHTGTKQFTDTSYARGVGDDMELLPYAEIHQPTSELLGDARVFVQLMLRRMEYDRIDKEWTAPLREVLDALNTLRST